MTVVSVRSLTDVVKNGTESEDVAGLDVSGPALNDEEISVARSAVSVTVVVVETVTIIIEAGAHA